MNTCVSGAAALRCAVRSRCCGYLLYSSCFEEYRTPPRLSAPRNKNLQTGFLNSYSVKRILIENKPYWLRICGICPRDRQRDGRQTLNSHSVSSEPDDRASSRAQRAAARRAQLLEAARKVVLRHGLERARIADIVAEAGGSQGLAHYHFPSREALLVEMLRTTAEDDVERARQIVRDTGTVVQRLDRLIRLALPISSDDWNWRLWVEMWVSGLRHDEIALISERFDTGWADTVRELLEEGVESEVVRCADPTATADRLSAMINGLGLRMVSSRAGFPRAYVIRLVRMAAALELGMDWQEYLRQGQEG